MGSEFRVFWGVASGLGLGYLGNWSCMCWFWSPVFLGLLGFRVWCVGVGDAVVSCRAGGGAAIAAAVA